MPRYRVPVILEIEANHYAAAVMEAERVGKLLLPTGRVRWSGVISQHSLPAMYGVGADPRTGLPLYHSDTPGTIDTEESGVIK